MATERDLNIIISAIDKASRPIHQIEKAMSTVERATRRYAKEADYLNEKLQKSAKVMKDVGQKMTMFATVPALAAGAAMVKFASDAEETQNKVQVAFGKNAEILNKWSKTAIKTMGLAGQSALDSAALYGDMATGMGISQGNAAKMAMSLTQLGADMASFKNISNDMAQTALKSIFTGETESLKNLGIVMTQANLQNFALSKGIRKKIDDMTEEEKVQLRYQFILAKTKNAQGDFLRTGGGFANQSRMFGESLKEIAATFGQYILPYATKAITVLNKVLVAFGSMPEPMKKFVLIFGGLLAITGPILIGLGFMTSALGGIIAFAPRFMFFIGLMKKWQVATNLMTLAQMRLNLSSKIWTFSLKDSFIWLNANKGAIIANTRALFVNSAQGLLLGVKNIWKYTAALSVQTGTLVAQKIAMVASTFANLGFAGSFRALGAAILATPLIGWVAALVTGAILLVQHWDKVVKIFQKVGSAVKGVAGAVGGFFAGGGNKIPAAESAGPVKKFDVGSTGITRTGLAIVHEGEKILPKGSRMGGSTSINFAPTLNFNGVSAGEAKQVAGVMKSEMEKLFKDMVHDYQRRAFA